MDQALSQARARIRILRELLRVTPPPDEAPLDLPAIRTMLQVRQELLDQLPSAPTEESAELAQLRDEYRELGTELLSRDKFLMSRMQALLGQLRRAMQQTGSRGRAQSYARPPSLFARRA